MFNDATEAVKKLTSELTIAFTKLTRRVRTISATRKAFDFWTNDFEKWLKASTVSTEAYKTNELLQ